MPHKEERKFSCICCGYLTCYEEGVGSTAYWQHKGAHALLGCAVGAAKSGDCASGAFGGVVGEIIGEEIANNTNISDKWVSATTQISTLFAASAAGLDFKTAQQTAKNAVENNALRIRREIKNRKVLEKLQELHEKVKDEYNKKYAEEIAAGKRTPLTDDNFWIDVTGGDRFFKEIDGKKVAVSRDTGNIIRDAAAQTAHAEELGARAGDIQFGHINAQKGDDSLKNVILDFLKNDVDIGGIDRSAIDVVNSRGKIFSNVNDEKDHIHFNFLNLKENYYNADDEPNPRDYEILPDSPIFPSNNSKSKHIPSWYCLNKNIGCLK